MSSLKIKKIWKNSLQRQFKNKKNDREKILDAIKDDIDIYSLAIKFAFYTPLRIGELLALQWNSIDGNKARIKKQRTKNCEMRDDLTFTPCTYETVNQTKGFNEKGMRAVFLSDKSLEILETIKENYASSEYIFANKDGKLLNTNAFNRRLEKICKKIGVEKRTSHKIRFCVASMYYLKGVPITQLQKFLGHTTVQMTMHYLRDIMDDKETEEIIKNLQ